MRDKIRHRLSVVVLCAVGVIVASGASRGALTVADASLEFPASGYFLNPCTKEIVEYFGYVDLRRGRKPPASRKRRRPLDNDGRGLEGTGTTTGDTYLITIDSGRTIAGVGNGNDAAEHVFKIDRMKVIHFGRTAASDWIVKDASIRTVTGENSLKKVAELVIRDKSCS